MKLKEECYEHQAFCGVEMQRNLKHRDTLAEYAAGHRSHSLTVCSVRVVLRVRGWWQGSTSIALSHSVQRYSRTSCQRMMARQHIDRILSVCSATVVLRARGWWQGSTSIAFFHSVQHYSRTSCQRMMARQHIDRTLSQCAALQSYFVSEDDGKAAHRSHSLTECSTTVVLRVRGWWQGSTSIALSHSVQRYSRTSYQRMVARQHIDRTISQSAELQSYFVSEDDGKAAHRSHSLTVCSATVVLRARGWWQGSTSIALSHRVQRYSRTSCQRMMARQHIDRTLSQSAALQSYFVSEDDGKAAHRYHSLTVCSATVVRRVRGWWQGSTSIALSHRVQNYSRTSCQRMMARQHIDRTLSQCAALQSYFVSEDDGKAAHRSHSLTVCSTTVVLRIRGWWQGSTSIAFSHSVQHYSRTSCQRMVARQHIDRTLSVCSATVVLRVRGWWQGSTSIALSHRVQNYSRTSCQRMMARQHIDRTLSQCAALQSYFVSEDGGKAAHRSHYLTECRTTVVLRVRGWWQGGTSISLSCCTTVVLRVRGWWQGGTSISLSCCTTVVLRVRGWWHWATRVHKVSTPLFVLLRNIIYFIIQFLKKPWIFINAMSPITHRAYIH